MNHLEKIKQQLMVKPDVQERERVAVVIKGEKRHRKPRVQTDKKKDETIGKQIEEGIIDLSEQISEIQEREGILPVSVDVEESEEEQEEESSGRPIIIDKTDVGYDRKALLDKLAESKKTKVTIKPLVEIEQKIIEPATTPLAKKAKKIGVKTPLIIEGEEEEEEELGKKDVVEEEEEFVFKKKVAFKEESPEEFVLKKKEKEGILIIPPKEKKRKTEKVEKGVAILGPEVIVELGDTDLTRRLPRRFPPVNIKVASYIMNNRETFVNFINSL